MVKKCIIALAVVALLVIAIPASAQPGNTIKRDGDWPWTYKAIDICTMPVYMEVGHFVQLKECNKRKIELVQVTCDTIGKSNTDDFPCYSDCEDIEVRANFPAIFGASLSKGSVGILKDTSIYWAGDKNQILGSTGGWEKLTVCLDAWKAEIWKSTEASKKVQVGTLTINVKPPDTGS